MLKKLIIISLVTLITNQSNASDYVHPVIKSLAQRFSTTPDIIIPALKESGFNPTELTEGTVSLPASATSTIRNAIGSLKKAKTPTAGAASRKASKPHRSDAKNRKK